MHYGFWAVVEGVASLQPAEGAAIFRMGKSPDAAISLAHF